MISIQNSLHVLGHNQFSYFFFFTFREFHTIIWSNKNIFFQLYTKVYFVCCLSYTYNMYVRCTHQYKISRNISTNIQHFCIVSACVCRGVVCCIAQRRRERSEKKNFLFYFIDNYSFGHSHSHSAFSLYIYLHMHIFSFHLAPSSS